MGSQARSATSPVSLLAFCLWQGVRGLVIFGLIGALDGLLLYWREVLPHAPSFLARALNLGWIYGLAGALLGVVLAIGVAVALRVEGQRRAPMVLLALTVLGVAPVVLRHVNAVLLASPSAPASLIADLAVLLVAAGGAWWLWRRRALLVPGRMGLAPVELGVLGLSMAAFLPLYSSLRHGEQAEADLRVVREAERRPNILWIAIDTLRADHLGCYGYERPTSPSIDRLAREGVLFEQAIAQAPWTAPSAASYLSSTLSFENGCTARNPLKAEVATFPEISGALGYRTHVFAENPVISTSFNLTQGCDVYRGIQGASWQLRTAVRHRLRLVRRSSLYTYVEKVVPESVLEGLLDPLWLLGSGPDERMPASAVNREVVRMLAAADDQPAFVYLHWMGPHDPYKPSLENGKRFRSPSFAGREWMREQGDSFPPTDLRQTAEEEYQDIVDRYDGCIRDYDDLVGELLAMLEAEGLLHDTFVVLMSDHGEEFLEHGGWQHGHSLHNEVIQVPLILRLPGGAAAGQRVGDTVQLLDVAPTLLAYLGADVETRIPIRGRNLLPLLDGDRDPEPAFSLNLSSFDPAVGEMFAMIDEARGLAVLEHMDPVDPSLTKEVLVYDLGQDPEQTRNLVGSGRPGVMEIVGQLRQWREAQSAQLARSSTALSEAQHLEMEETLRELGYIE